MHKNFKINLSNYKFFKYPTKLPEGYKLVRVDVTEGSKIDKNRYYGMNTIIYQGPNNKKIEIWEGLADLGAVEDLEEVRITDKITGKFWKWRGYDNELGLTIFNNCRSSDFQYYILGKNVSRKEMIDIVVYLKNL